MRRVEVEWVDAAGIKLGWSAPADYDLAATAVYSVGWLLHEHEDRIVLALSHAPAEEKGAFEAREIVSDGLVIPRGAIRAIRELRRR